MITDITMPGMSGMEVLAKVRQRDADIPVIIITAYGTIESAVEAMKQGAFDYITKPVSRDELRLTLEKAIRMRRLEKENVELRAEVTDRYRFESIIGSSEKMKEVLDLAGRVAASDASLLITGESGTGKELLAKGVHFNSRRAAGSLCCRELRGDPRGPDRERALRPCERRSFTGAVKDKEGKFELADGGTLFLDEIGDLRIDLQAKILRALQEREVDRVGGGKPALGGCARDRGHEQGHRAGGEGRCLSRGPVLPPERYHPLHPAAARAERRHPLAGQLFPEKVQ